MTVVPRALLWFGLLGAPLAWTAQLIVGYGVTEADCGAGGMRWGIDTVDWEVALTAATATVALAAGIGAGWLLREKRLDNADPRGRIEFMASGGLLVSGVFLVLILLGGIGSFYLQPCQAG